MDINLQKIQRKIKKNKLWNYQKEVHFFKRTFRTKTRQKFLVKNQGIYEMLPG